MEAGYNTFEQKERLIPKTDNNVSIERGFTEADRDMLEELAHEAFGQKLGWMYYNRLKESKELLRAYLQPETTLVARDTNTGEILGYCLYGTKETPENKELDGVVNRHNNWRAIFLILLDYKAKEGELYIKQLVVHSKTRGRGIGSLLLQESYQVAEEQNCDRVSLHVILENDNAKRLYNREGFEDKDFGRLCCCFPYFFAYALSGYYYLVKVLQKSEFNVHPI
jgi:ribosomal protein S18 acetylase RimI-like enzyme